MTNALKYKTGRGISWRSYLKRTPDNIQWTRAVSMYLRKLIRRNDAAVTGTLLEIQMLIDTTPSAPRQTSWRSKTPTARALGILGLLKRAKLHNGKPVTAWSVLLKVITAECRCLHDPALIPFRLSHVPARHLQWRQFNVARSVWQLTNRDSLETQFDNGRGTVQTRIHTYRYRLNSRHVARRLHDQIEPSYRVLLHDHHDKIAAFKAHRDYRLGHM